MRAIQKNAALVLTLALSLAVPAFAAGSRFSDVAAVDWCRANSVIAARSGGGASRCGDLGERPDAVTEEGIK